MTNFPSSLDDDTTLPSVYDNITEIGGEAINAQKVVCIYCSRKFLARKLIPHHKYFCGPEAERTARLAKTERKRATTTQKAMKTLRIGTNTAPTMNLTDGQKSFCLLGEATNPLFIMAILGVVGGLISERIIGGSSGQ